MRHQIDRARRETRRRTVTFIADDLGHGRSWLKAPGQHGQIVE